MNVTFLPNEKESKLIQIVQKYCRNEFALIRMTQTMLNKNIIDASEDIRMILRDEIADYKVINQGEKISGSSVVITNEIIENRTSYYRPNTKNGDPRFWVSRLHRFVSDLDLVYFTSHESRLIVIPLIDHPKFEEEIKAFFGINEKDFILEELKKRISSLKKKDWVISVSPDKFNDKDIGETLERELGVKINNLKGPDFEGQIELKGKNLTASTLDTLFGMVPNWKISTLKKVNEILNQYGYPDNEYEGYKALFVNVSNKPNRQGLFLEVDEENELIHQKCIIDGKVIDVCCWNFEDVKERLYNKHPKTMWIKAKRMEIEGKIHFKFLKVQFTQRPIFSQFLSLIQQGIVIYNWRGRVNLGTGIPLSKSKLDYGHCFRLNPSKRNLLFGETIDLEL